MIAATAIVPAHEATAVEPACPYIGLEPFSSGTANLFFGRDDQRNECIRRLQDRRWLAIVGMSGAGKSSLVRAGIVPALEMGHLRSDTERWTSILARPGEAPIRKLADVLVRKLKPGGPGETTAVDQVEKLLRASPHGLLHAVEALGGWDRNVLLVVDQFEEIFRLGHDLEAREEWRAERAMFVQLLLEPRLQSKHPLYVVLTIRSEFLGACTAFYGLPDALNEGQFLVPRLTRAQLEQAIVSPPRVVGAKLSHALARRVLNDAMDMQDELPVVQHALKRTFEHWKERVQKDHLRWDEEIGIVDYEKAGTVRNAISQHGDEVFGLLDAGAKLAAKVLFRRITRTDSKHDGEPDAARDDLATTQATRDPAAYDMILEIVESRGIRDAERALDDALRKFRSESCQFLVPANPFDKKVDITHEAVPRRWAALRTWMSQEFLDADAYRRLTDAERDLGSAPDVVLQGKRLEEFDQWWHAARPTEPWARRYFRPDGPLAREKGESDQARLKRYHAVQFERISKFLERSVAAREAERQRVLREEGARRRQRAIFIAAVPVMLCLAVFATWQFQRYHAEQVAKEGEQTLIQVVTTKLKAAKTDSQAGDAWKQLAPKLRPAVAPAAEEYWSRRATSVVTAALEMSKKRCTEEAFVLKRYAQAGGVKVDKELDSLDQTFGQVVATVSIGGSAPQGCLREAPVTCTSIALAPPQQLVGLCDGHTYRWTLIRDEGLVYPKLDPGSAEGSQPGQGTTFATIAQAGDGASSWIVSAAHGSTPGRMSLVAVGADGSPLVGNVPAFCPEVTSVAAVSFGTGFDIAFGCAGGQNAARFAVRDSSDWARAVAGAQQLQLAGPYINDVAWAGKALVLATNKGLFVDNRPAGAGHDDIWHVRAFSGAGLQLVAWGTAQTERARARIGVVDGAGNVTEGPDLPKSPLPNYRVDRIAGGSSRGQIVALGAGGQNDDDRETAVFVTNGKELTRDPPVTLPTQNEKVGDVAIIGGFGDKGDATFVAAALQGRIRVFSLPAPKPSEDAWTLAQRITGLTVDDETFDVKPRKREPTRATTITTVFEGYEPSH
jgi:hypothetical protein